MRHSAANIGFNCSVSFPATFESVTNALNVVNLDVVPALALSCYFSGYDYVGKLLLMTLAPLAIGGTLGIAYLLPSTSAPHRELIAYAFLFFTFVIMVGASTTIFHFFKCDDFPEADGGTESYLFKDYSLDCSGTRYTTFVVYAAAMVLVYPIGESDGCL